MKDLSTLILKFILQKNGGDLEAAQETVQETFLAISKSFHTFHNKSSYVTWVCKIALNKMRDYYRHQVHYRSKIVIPAIDVLNNLVDPKISLEEQVSLDELKTSVNQCLNLLPEKYRRLLHLKYYRQLSSMDISKMLNLTPRQLEGQLYRAKLALSKVISSLHPDLKP